jgi:uncharacterized protein (TIGR03083 family)
VEISQHIMALADQGSALLGAAEAAGTEAAVPTCPGWTVADLLGHVGGVHRWAASYLTSGRDRELGPDEETEYFAVPEDASLPAWARQGYEQLLVALEQAPPDLTCWTFLPAPSPLAFWARRQAHETAVHRADAESAAGRRSQFEPGLAADGVDELLSGLFGRPGRRPVAAAPVVLSVETTDAAGLWAVTLGPDGINGRRRTSEEPVEDDGLEPACRLRGPASDMYLLLWNRLPLAGTEVALTGDAGVLDLWRQRAHVHWS